MAPNHKVVAAFRAMKSIGISEDAVKPVLKSLLKLYDKNWELIEEENYRVLADAIFENQEKLASKKEKRSEVVDPDEDFEAESPVCTDQCPPKRLRTGRHGSQISPSKLPEDCYVQPPLNIIAQTPPNLRGSGTKVSEVKMEQLHGNIAAVPVLPLNSGTKELPSTFQPLASIPSDGLNDEETARLSQNSLSSMETSNPRKGRVDPGVVLSPREKVSCGTHILIVPKDEPFTDTSQVELPIPVPHSEPPQAIERIGTDCFRNIGENHVAGTQDSHSKTGTEDEVRHIPPGCGRVLEVASSELGEVKISLNCYHQNGWAGFHTPEVSEVEKIFEAKYAARYKVLDRSFSLKEILKDVCECVVELGKGTHIGTEKVSLSPVPAMSSLALGSYLYKAKISVAPLCAEQIASMAHSSVIQTLKESSISEAGPLAIIQQHQTANDAIRFIHDIEDITKGEENVKISWVNDMSNEIPPPFRYISQSLIFQNASITVSLARITGEDCCLSCFGDCLASHTPCLCALKHFGGFAYTLGGILKDGFFDAYISMHRNYQNHNLFYCKACPIEQWRSNDFMEACKGHIMKSFIKECWSKCGCNRNCSNRTVQRGLSYNLQVFYTLDGRGWGLRTLDNIPKGAFVCEIVGEILTCKELFERSGTRRTQYAVILDAGWSSCESLRPEKALCLDSHDYGNIARFINHRCLDANLVDIPVEVESPDLHYYHLALFATRNVDALEELTWDYGIDFEDSDNDLGGFWCICGSQYCRNIKRPSKTQSD